jgi:MoxR-like ATPase
VLTQDLTNRMLTEARKVLVGQEEAFQHLVVSLLAGGHVLLEGVPGTAKTLMAKALALMVRGEFTRIQFTPDLMPSDIVGTSVFDLASSRFHLKKGPVFTNILLADEVNRAPAKTQSALLEAMEERQVTIEGERHLLSPLFMVIATQNPIEYEGTYPLPEAQLDRFFFKVLIDYPAQNEEEEVLRRYHAGFDARELEQAGLEPVADEAQLAACRDEVQNVIVDEDIMHYITSIAVETRRSLDLILGGSPRASITLLLAAKVMAAMEDRDYVVPDDVKTLVPAVYRHRIILKPEAEIEGLNADAVMRKVLGRVEVPR